MPLTHVPLSPRLCWLVCSRSVRARRLGPCGSQVRLVPGKAGIAFVEFETEAQSGVAMSGLQNFKITPQNLMKVSYAKR